jgi:hypothetical protein
MSYIEKEALLEHKRKMKGFDLSIEYWSEAVLCEDIRNAPTADVVEVRHGYWKDRYGNKFANRHYECSVCQEPALDRAKIDSLMTAYHEQYLSPFCPHCGAKMDGERRTEND